MIQVHTGFVDEGNIVMVLLWFPLLQCSSYAKQGVNLSGWEGRVAYR